MASGKHVKRMSEKKFKTLGVSPARLICFVIAVCPAV